MKILVMSDSHRRGDIVDKIIEREKGVNEIFFLGDLVSDIEDLIFAYPNKNFHIVSGNCDMMSMTPISGLAKIGDISILFCHGHNFRVKSGTDYILTAARECNCKIVLYGHTHIPKIDIIGGIFAINPGSVAEGRNGKETYCVIDIEGEKIYPEIKEVKI